MIEVKEPPIGEGVDAVAGWAQSVGAVLVSMPGKRAVAARAALEALGRVRGAARDCEALLTALEQRGERVEDAAGPEAPRGEIALPLWQWYEAARLVWCMCGARESDLRDLGTQVKGLVSQVRARPTAEAENVRRRYRLPRDAREAVREHEEITARLAEEAIDQETIEESRMNLLTFATYMKRHFRTGPHLEYLCAALERVERGECKRLVVNMPPRHGKTEIVSRLFPAWFLGRHPDRAVLLATHTAAFVGKIGRSIRNNISSDEFSRVFPAVTLSTDSQAAAAFEVVDGDGRRSKRGVFSGYGMGGSYTGEGADLLIFDDLLTEVDSGSEAALETMRESVQALYTRLASSAAWIVVNTRYNERDTVAYLLSEYAGEGWEVVSLPALAERDEEYPLPGGRTWRRKLGEALFPFHFPREWLEGRRAQLMQTNPSAWWGQYQCRPTPTSGNLVRLEWFAERRYRDSPIALLDDATRVTVSVDTSAGKTEKAARTAISVWAERRGGAYLIYCYSKAIQTPEQLDVIKSICAQWRPQLLIIEDKSTGESLIPLLRRDTDWVRTPILAERPRGSKVERMSAVLPQMADGQVWLPCDGHPAAPWLPSLLDELAFYPKGAFLDQGDTVSQFLLWRSRNPLSASPAPITAPKPVANAFAGSWGLRPTGRRTSW